MPGDLPKQWTSLWICSDGPVGIQTFNGSSSAMQGLQLYTHTHNNPFLVNVFFLFAILILWK